EDGIRDGHVTGVQTCALPIYLREPFLGELAARACAAPDASLALQLGNEGGFRLLELGLDLAVLGAQLLRLPTQFDFAVGGDLRRSEERRVGNMWKPRDRAATD